MGGLSRGTDNNIAKIEQPIIRIGNKQIMNSKTGTEKRESSYFRNTGTKSFNV